MIRPALILLVLPFLILPRPGFGDSTNEPADLFGITVSQTQQVSQAEILFEQGARYFSGEGGETNLARAVEYFTKSAALGYARAQFNLGLCYLEGKGVEPSEEQAAKWFRKAAEQGIREAFTPLGFCCHNLGQFPEAYAWALYAEAQGDARLRQTLDPMYSDEEKAEGKARFEKLVLAAAARSKKTEEAQEQGADSR